VVNLVCKKEDSVSCWFKTHQPRQGQRPIGRFFVLFYKVVFFWFFGCVFFTDLNLIPVHLTVISLQNVKDAAKGQNDYKMSGLLSNATFMDKAVYHSGYITKYLLTRTTGTS
jgi:hypothetical protein